MKQVNMWITDELHMLLVKEAGKRMQKDGIYIKPSKAAAIIIEEYLGNNSNMPSETPTQDSEPTENEHPLSKLDI